MVAWLFIRAESEQKAASIVRDCVRCRGQSHLLQHRHVREFAHPDRTGNGSRPGGCQEVLNVATRGNQRVVRLYFFHPCPTQTSPTLSFLVPLLRAKVVTSTDYY